MTDNFHGKSDYQWISFNGFCFPILPSLKYQADGPKKGNPDRLFIEDKDKRFLFYLETGNREYEELWESLTDYDTVEIHHKNKRLKIRYPLQKMKPNICVGYFHIVLNESENIEHHCYGELSIRLPQSYFTGLRKYDELYTLFANLTAIEDN